MALSSSRARAAEPFWPERARALPRGPFSEGPAARFRRYPPPRRHALHSDSGAADQIVGGEEEDAGYARLFEGQFF